MGLPLPFGAETPATATASSSNRRWARMDGARPQGPGEPARASAGGWWPRRAVGWVGSGEGSEGALGLGHGSAHLFAEKQPTKPLRNLGSAVDCSAD